jgi:hypothetical protein
MVQMTLHGLIIANKAAHPGRGGGELHAANSERTRKVAIQT